MRNYVLTFALALLGGGALDLSAQANLLPKACGPDATQYKVKVDKKAPAPDALPPAKARLVLLQQIDGEFEGTPTSRFAVDGNWVGAAKGNSYFSVDLAPGDYELCASRQSSIRSEKADFSTTRLTLKAGETYFYAFKLGRGAAGSPTMKVDPRGVPGSSMTAKDAGGVDSVDLLVLDSNTASTLVRTLPRAEATAK